MYSIFLITWAVASSGILVASHTNHIQKRQAFFDLPNFLTIRQFPVISDQTTAARCQDLAGQSAPAGCVYVSDIDDSTGSPLNCRLECQSGVAFPFQLRSVLGQFGAIVPDYLVNDRFNTIDLSGSDTFVGDSYFLFTPPTTTTIAQASVTTTATVASAAATTATASFGTPVTPVTVPPLTTTTLSPVQLITSCIDRGQDPGPTCSFNGNGLQPPLLGCAVTCAQGDAGTACDATGLSEIDQCLCQNGKVTPPGKPSSKCTYLPTGKLPLTCPTICNNPPFGRRK